MLETKEIHFRLTGNQLAVIKVRAEVRGYNSISAFVRDEVIKTPPKVKQLLLEIYENLSRGPS